MHRLVGMGIDDISKGINRCRLLQGVFLCLLVALILPGLIGWPWMPILTTSEGGLDLWCFRSLQDQTELYVVSLILWLLFLLVFVLVLGSFLCFWFWRTYSIGIVLGQGVLLLMCGIEVYYFWAVKNAFLPLGFVPKGMGFYVFQTLLVLSFVNGWYALSIHRSLWPNPELDAKSPTSIL